MDRTDARNRVYAANKKVKFESSMLKSTLCDYKGLYLLVRWIISVANNTIENGDIKKHKAGAYF